jgi:hypothetical protein
MEHNRNVKNLARVRQLELNSNAHYNVVTGSKRAVPDLAKTGGYSSVIGKEQMYSDNVAGRPLRTNSNMQYVLSEGPRLD